MTTMKVGPFEFEREDNGGCECWDVVIPKGSGLPHFCVKNYGGEPHDGSPFSGWRLVSGGPFTQAGGWTSRNAAMSGVAPFLLRFYRRCVADKLEEVRRMRASLKTFERAIASKRAAR